MRRPQPDSRIRFAIFRPHKNSKSMGIQNTEGIFICEVVAEIGDPRPMIGTAQNLGDRIPFVGMSDTQFQSRLELEQLESWLLSKAAQAFLSA